MSLKVSVSSRRKVLTPVIMIYEQDSQMALSCFHYDDSLLCKCLTMQKKSDLGDTTWKCSRQSYKLYAQPFENYSKVCFTLLYLVRYSNWVQDTEYVCFTFLLHSLCNSNLFRALGKRKKNTPLLTTNINSLWVDRCTAVNNITVHIGTEHTEYCKSFKHISSHQWELRFTCENLFDLG